MEGANERVYRKVREFVRQKQEEKLPKVFDGIRLEDIAQSINEKEEVILLALSHKAWRGELVGTDILITFSE